MNLATLKTVAAAYMDRSVADLTVNGTDMFLVAANNARREAELLHNFEYAKFSTTLDIDGVVGTDLGDISLLPDFSHYVTVTGSPAAGTFYRTGVYNLWPFYTNPLLGYVLWSNGVDTWYITTVANLGNILTAGWQHSAVDDFSLIGVDYGIAGSYVAFGSASGTLSVAALVSAYQSIKEVINASGLQVNNVWVPIDFTRSDIAVERARSEGEFYAYDDDYRYPSDRVSGFGGASRTLIQRGTVLSIYPDLPEALRASGTYRVQIECYGWLREYVAADYNSSTPTDFLVRYGYSYLQWAVLCELNFLFQQYVPRTEGSVSSPEKQKEEAWRKLMLWDSYMVDSHVTRSR